MMRTLLLDLEQVETPFQCDTAELKLVQGLSAELRRLIGDDSQMPYYWRSTMPAAKEDAD